MIPRTKAPRPAKPTAAEPAANCPPELVRYRDWDFLMNLPGLPRLAFSLLDEDSIEENDFEFLIDIKATGEHWQVDKAKLAAYRMAERVVERPAKPMDPKVH